MKLVAHGKVPGPCLSPSIKVHGMTKQVTKCKTDIFNSDPRIKNISTEHRLSVRIDFHLKTQRLWLSDLDNLSKTVLDGIFGTFGKAGIKPSDRFVWRLETQKIKAEDEEFTEFWVFDEGSIKRQ